MTPLRCKAGGRVALMALAGFSSAAAAAPSAVPACRMDDSAKSLLADTFVRAAAAFKEIGKPLPFDIVKVNEPGAAGTKTLTAFVVTDANEGSVSEAGCASAGVKKDLPLDDLSVRGGCVLVAVEHMEVRCSANALRIFGDAEKKSDRANPALLYVLAHELGHLYQRRLGEYSGRAERIALNQDRAVKLELLKSSCDPASTGKEEEADALAVDVLRRAVARPPYREPLFSERGAMYWNIDQLALASDAWQRASLEQEFMSQPKVHRSFVPTEFPTSAKKVDANAQRFVCDVLTKKKGDIYHPLRSLTHPPLEQRLRRIAEALQPIAEKLPDNSAQKQFTPIARLQTDVGPIFTQIYRETGVYMENILTSICTKVNAPTPPGCR